MSIIGSNLSAYGAGYGVVEGGATEPSKPELGDSNAELLPVGEVRASGPGSIATELAAANAASAGINFDMGDGIRGVWNGTGFSLINPLWGQSATYRMMDDQPTLKLARRLTTVPILASSPTVQPVEGRKPKPQWIQFIKDAFLPQMGTVARHGLRMLSYGCSMYHERWDARDGRLWPTLIPKPVDRCMVYLYSTGNAFAGIRFIGAQKLWSPSNCLLVSHDVEADNLYGHSEHDAAYEPWCRWLQMRMDAHLLRSKLSGIIPIVYYPPGETSVNGVMVDNAIIADQLIAPQLNKHLGMRLPSVPFTAKQLVDKPELGSLSLWKIDFYDAGNLAAAQSGFIESMSYEDVQMLRAWGTPERSAVEGQHGTKAEAGQHSDNATQTKQLIANDLMSQVTRGQPAFGVWGSVDKALLFNFGPEAVGTIEIRAASIADTDLESQSKLLTSLLSSNDPNVVYNILDMLGGEGVKEAFSNFGFNPRGDLDTAALKQQLVEAAQQRQMQARGSSTPVDPDIAKNGSAARATNRRNGKSLASMTDDELIAHAESLVR